MDGPAWFDNSTRERGLAHKRVVDERGGVHQRYTRTPPGGSAIKGDIAEGWYSQSVSASTREKRARASLPMPCQQDKALCESGRGGGGD